MKFSPARFAGLRKTKEAESAASSSFEDRRRLKFGDAPVVLSNEVQAQAEKFLQAMDAKSSKKVPEKVVFVNSGAMLESGERPVSAQEVVAETVEKPVAAPTFEEMKEQEEAEGFDAMSAGFADLMPKENLNRPPRDIAKRRRERALARSQNETPQNTSDRPDVIDGDLIG